MKTEPKVTGKQDSVVRGVNVAGVVSIESTNQGISGITVEILHSAKSPLRLGSTVTGPAGRFSVTIADDQIKKLPGQSLNIQIVILAPERPKLSRADRILFTSEVRENAALREVFLVELPLDLLDCKGLQHAVNNARPFAERRAEAIGDSARAAKIISETAKKLAVIEIEKEGKRRRFFNDVVAPSVRIELSNVTQSERANPRFVADEEAIYNRSIQAQHDELVKLREIEDDGSGAPIKKVRRQSRLQLEAETLKRLGQDQPNGIVRTVTREQLESTLGVSLDKPTSIQRSGAPSDPCRPKIPGETCLETGEVNTPRTDAGVETGGDRNSDDDRDANGSRDASGNIAGGNVGFDSGMAIAALMDSQTAPEHTVVFDNLDAQLEGRLSPNEVATALGGISLTPGPADVPSFHDFSSLQLAFESVWQEAIDDRILDDVESAYDRIVESGLETSDDGTWNMQFIGTTFSAFVETVKAVPSVVASNVRISLEEYRALPDDTRVHLNTLAASIDGKRADLITALGPPEPAPGGTGSHGGISDFIVNMVESGMFPSISIADLMLGGSAGGARYNRTAISLLEQIRILDAEADRIVSHARQIIIDRERGRPFRPNHEIIQRLRTARSSAYPFRHFAASRSQRSVNFGLMITYRQRWTPVSYQVGDLVSTIALGPNSSRKYKIKEVRHQRRLEKELESNLSNSKFDSETKSRAEAEILAKASGKTSFSHNAKGSFQAGVEGGMSGGGESTSTFSADAERHSQDTKKNMRESVIKAAEERKRETKMEVESEETYESEFTESGELSNPNHEIPVTFLLYELQRRYKINAKLHELKSVVCVAQEMPKANEIDPVWLIQHDWILNRVLLDDSFKPALGYVSTTLVSEREALSHMRRALLDQQTLVEQIKEDLADRRSVAGLRYAALERQIERTAQAAGDSGGIWDTVTDVVSGGGLLGGILGGGDEGQDNASKIRESAARDAWERERKEEDAFRNRLGDAQSTLATMRTEFHDRLSKHLGEVTQVERLATHIYQNIMYYMQAIWSHEPDDQRLLRLRDVPIPDLQPDVSKQVYHLPVDLRPEFDFDNIVGVLTESGTIEPLAPEDIPTKPLVQVADLSSPLGFMGNYMILPMYETNALTDFMMDPYVEFAGGEYGISDPDPAGNMSLDEFSDYVCCLKKKLSTERFEMLAPGLNDRLKTLLQRSVRENEEIIVGTGNLYIECLVGTHSVMEQFKHLHRQIDVKAAQEKLRTTAIDNVRRAQRILNKDLEDPEIEAKYVFEGDGSATVVAPPPNDG